MEIDTLVVFTVFAIGCTFLLFLKTSFFERKKSPSLPCPPGPPRRVITGNITDVRHGPYPEPYRCITELAKEYGDVMSLRLGMKMVVIFSSSAAAKEVLNRHDDVLSDRAVRHVITANDLHKTSVIWMSPGIKWRNIRKIIAVQILAPHRLASTQHVREEKARQLRDYVTACARSGSAVDVGNLIFNAVMNMISNTLFSIDFADYGSEVASEFEEIVFGLMEVNAQANPADSFPILRFIDPGKGRKKFGDYSRRLTDIFGNIIQERVATRRSDQMVASPGHCRNDVLDCILELKRNSECDLTTKDMNGIFLDLFVAGIDTSASVLEWAMAELIRNQEMIGEVRAELKEVLAPDCQLRETNVGNLPYLRAVVKEALRLYPPGAFLLPHRARSDIEIMGYAIPKDATVLVNAWAIGRDPKHWNPDPEKFVPKRFLDNPVDYKGMDYEFLPFGSGRRLCPGLPVATRMMHILLATLAQFDWKLEGGQKLEDLDMSPKPGVTLVKKAKPIRAIPIVGMSSH